MLDYSQKRIFHDLRKRDANLTKSELKTNVAEIEWIPETPNSNKDLKVP